MIEDFINTNIDFSFHFVESNFNLNNAPIAIRNSIEFLCNRLNFIYKFDLFCFDVFSPLAIFEDCRSVSINDLTDKDILFINSILSQTNNSILKARLNDIIGVFNKDKNSLIQSADFYYDYIKTNINISDTSEVIRAIERASFLYKYLKKFSCIEEMYDFILSKNIYDDLDREKILKYSVFMMLSKARININAYIDNINSTIDILELNDYQLKLDLIELLITFYKRNDSNKYNLYKKLYCNIVKEVVNQYPEEYLYIKKAIDFLDDNNDEDEINELRFLSEKTQGNLVSKMKLNEVKIDLDDNTNKIINNYLNQIDCILEKMSAIEQFILFLNQFKPIKEIEMYKVIDEYSKNSLFDLCNTRILDGDNILFESATATKEDIKEYKISLYLKLHCQVVYNFFIENWNNKRKIDNELLDLLHDITYHNLLIPKDKQDVVLEIITKTLKDNDYTKGIYNIIAQFEYGCKSYLKEYKGIYPKIGKKGKAITLGDILVQKGDKLNKKRKEISDVIGDDLTLMLEYLLCRKLSSNLRNKYYHEGYSNSSKNIIEDTIAFFYIVEAYCMGYDETI